MKKITLLAALFAGFAMNAQVTIWEDGFENYDDFAFSVIGDYSQIDNDGDTTYLINGTTFENEGYTGTAIVFNPSMTTPSSVGTDFDTRSGDKGLYMFASDGSVSGVPQNDDYIITPQIDLTGALGSTFSFWAKSVTDQYGLEKIEVLLSTTGTAEGDFTELLSNGVEEVPIDFTEYLFDLSAYDGMPVYIAIHYVTSDAFVLQMDDFKVTASTLGVSDQTFEGFKYFVANNNLNLSTNTSMEKVALYNMLGQQVISQKLNSNNETVSLSGLQSGVYIATVSIDGASKSFKIVKN